jgi:UDP-N-acetylmuramate dehydrogenase
VPVRLAELTTLRLGGPVACAVTAHTTEEVVAAVRMAEEAREPLLLIGGGSNLVAADAGWPGRVVRLSSTKVAVDNDAEDVIVRVDAGVTWDDLVARAVDEGWSGLAAMSAIPGLCGATPVQNVGAYGTEVADTIQRVTVYDRTAAHTTELTAAECGFGFRTSAFKTTDRFVVLDVTFRLRRSAAAPPVRYAELARRLGVAPGGVVSSADVRAAVVELRRSKGMVLDPADHDTWSVGSFFVNPFVPAGSAPPDCPRWSVDGRLKLSAAWLIENAGFPRGYGLDRGRGQVAVSTKHSLALTNRGHGTTAELIELAREIRAGVEERFRVRLRPEARLAGVALDDAEAQR